MLRDDPGPPEKKEFEFNTSLNSEITNQYQFSVPLLDINYGATERMQLKAEMPLLITVDESKNVSSNFGHHNIVIKYRFMDESKYHVGVSVFPEVVFDKRKEYLLPLQFEKLSGKIILRYLNSQFTAMKNIFTLLFIACFMLSVIFSFSQGTWTQKTNYGGAARYGAAGFTIGTKAYVGMGYSGAAYFQDFWEWDQTTDIWTQKASLPGVGRFGAV